MRESPASEQQAENSADPADSPAVAAAMTTAAAMREIGGPPGPEPTRFGDWEKAGRCIDF